MTKNKSFFIFAGLLGTFLGFYTLFISSINFFISIGLIIGGIFSFYYATKI